MTESQTRQLDVEQLQQERNVLKLQTEIAELNASLAMLQTGADRSLMESWGEPIDPREWLWGTPMWGRGAGAFSSMSDRSEGRDLPVVQCEQDLASIRGTARLLAQSFPTAICALKNLTNYCIGTGFSYKAVAKVDAARELQHAVQRVVDEFLDDNDWVGDLERELFVRSRRDGEFFLSLCPRRDGKVFVRVIEPEQVTEPEGPREIEDWLGTQCPSSWSFGVHTQADDVCTALGYYIKWNHSGTDWDYFPAEYLEHVKINVDRNVKRGLSDFHAVSGELEGAQKLLRNTREGAAVQAAIAFIREHVPGATKSGIEALRAGNAVSHYNQQTHTGGRTKYIQKYDPGTVLDVTHGMQYKPGPLGSSHGPNFISIHQAVLRMVGTRWCMPEYMISGDASNANFSSSLVAESPFVKACEAEQRFYRSRFRRLIWKVLHFAFQAGRFDSCGVNWATLRESIMVQIEPPAIAVRDRLKEAQTRQIEHQNGVLSKRTWALETGRDYEVEQQHLCDDRQCAASEGTEDREHNGTDSQRK